MDDTKTQRPAPSDDGITVDNPTPEKRVKQYVVVLWRMENEVNDEDCLDIWADGVECDATDLIFYRFVQTTRKKHWAGIFLVEEEFIQKKEIVARVSNYRYFVEVGDASYGGIDPRIL